jgi:hypothetical protein
MDFQRAANDGGGQHEHMWARSRGGELAAVAGVVTTLGLIAVAPVWVGFAAVVAGACMWCRFVEADERGRTREALAVLQTHVAAHETVYVFGRTSAGTARAMSAVRRLAGDAPVELAVFVIHHARPGTPAPASTVTAIRQIGEARGLTTKVMACACRGPNDVAPWLAPASAVVIERSGPPWWPTFGRRLTTALRRAGCRVAVA